MFAEQWRRTEKSCRRTHKIDGTADEIRRSHPCVLDLPGNAEVLDLGIVKDFLDRIDWSVRNLVFVESRQPVFTRHRTECFLEYLDDFPMAITAVFASGKTGIVEQISSRRGFEQPFPCFLMR